MRDVRILLPSDGDALPTVVGDADVAFSETRRRVRWTADPGVPEAPSAAVTEKSLAPGSAAAVKRPEFGRRPITATTRTDATTSIPERLDRAGRGCSLGSRE